MYCLEMLSKSKKNAVLLRISVPHYQIVIIWFTGWYSSAGRMEKYFQKQSVDKESERSEAVACSADDRAMLFWFYALFNNTFYPIHNRYQ